MRAQALSTVRVSDRNAGGPKISTVSQDQSSTRGSAGAPSNRTATQSCNPVRRGLSIQSLLSLEYWIPAFAGMTSECDFAISRR